MSINLNATAGSEAIQIGGVDAIPFDANGLKIGAFNDGVITGSKLASDVPFTKGFTSAEQTITAAGALTIPHGLGSSPSLMVASLICKTANGGYAIGDEINIPSNVYATSVADNYGLCLYSNDAINIRVAFGASASTILAVRKDTGAGVALTNSSWKLIVKAWA
jgi:hypothetical protein